VSDAGLAAALFAVDPVGFGGVVLRGPPDTARDAWLAHLRSLLPSETPWRRMPAHIADDRLLGGLDLVASLAASRPVAQRGLLAEADGGIVLAAMAERLSEGAAIRAAAVMDSGEAQLERDGMAARFAARFGLVLLDEGGAPEEAAPATLAERCAFRLQDLSGATVFSAAEITEARRRLAAVSADDVIPSLCEAALAFGVDSARAALFAVRAARASAALAGRDCATVDDAAAAARLVLAPRATRAPAEHDDAAPPPPAEDRGSDEEAVGADAPVGDVVLAAVQAALPEGVLNGAAAVDRRRHRAGGAGARAMSAQRGRPVGVRAGTPRGGARLALMETLRAAAPWQRLRGAEGRIAVRREDLRVRRFAERRQSTTVLLVDASGSAAFQRLAEVKGAVELLLADAYVTRARVALVAFRNTGADILLPPTRSLTRARRRLAELAGGGPTPLAHGIEAGLLVAQSERERGRTPRLLLLSDGRANVARDGAHGRAQGESDAMAAARLVRVAGIDAIHIDTSPQALPGADRLAQAMGARYAPLPYVRAEAVTALARDAR
jgi:magnesium chelatase subunit D